MTSVARSILVRSILLLAFAGFLSVASAQPSDTSESADPQAEIDALLDLVLGLDEDIATVRESVSPLKNDIDELRASLQDLQAQVAQIAAGMGGLRPQDPNGAPWGPGGEWNIDPNVGGIGGGGNWSEGGGDVLAALAQVQEIPGSRLELSGNEFSFFVPLEAGGRAVVSAETQAALRRLGAADALGMELIVPEAQDDRLPRNLALPRLPSGVAYAQMDGETRYTFQGEQPMQQIEAIFEVLDGIAPNVGGE